MGRVSKLHQTSIALKKTEAETESLQRKSVDEIDFDRPLYSLVLSKFGDLYYERCKSLLPSVVDPSRLARGNSQRRLEHWDPTIPAQAIG